jgi:hypothetical protein
MEHKGTATKIKKILKTTNGEANSIFPNAKEKTAKNTV